MNHSSHVSLLNQATLLVSMANVLNTRQICDCTDSCKAHWILTSKSKCEHTFTCCHLNYGSYKFPSWKLDMNGLKIKILYLDTSNLICG